MKQKIFPLLWFLLSLLASKAYSQCLEVAVEEQVQICSAEQGTLNAVVGGIVLFSEWMPAKGLDNPLSLHPIVKTPFDTTYTITVKGFNDTTNLLINGDFNEGDSGFTSQYEAKSTKPGGYIIGKLGTELFPEAKECEDHSSPEGGGNMLMVKVSDTENISIYCQEIAVSPNQDYHFRGFATGLKINDPPVIVLKINDKTISIGTLGSFACSWQQIKGDWNSENATTAKICISVSPEDIGAGTDFVLDDLGFYEVCEVTKSTAVKVIDFEVIAPQDEVGLPCGDSLRLNIAIEPSDIFFLSTWTTFDGNIVAGANALRPVIDEPGIYEVEVMTTLKNQLCSDKKSIRVEYVSTDSLSILPTGSLNCKQRQTTLQATDEVNRDDFLYQWATVDGNIISEKDAPNILIDQAGTYQLQRTDILGNCPLQESIIIEEKAITDFSFDLMLPNCDQAAGTLLFDKITGGVPPFNYSIDGGITFQPDRFFPNLTGGNYSLLLQDANNCQFEKTTSFTAFTPIQLTLPKAIALKKGDDYTLPLVVNLPDSLISQIQWTPFTGLSCTDCLQPTTNRPVQQYQVAITDKNGCTDQATIQINLVEPSDVYIPSAFSPNQDGENDIFLIHANAQIVKKVQRFSIFDRYGNLVFDRFDFLPNDSKTGWDGRFKGKLMSEGVYVYWTEVLMEDGQREIFRGEIALVR